VTKQDEARPKNTRSGDAQLKAAIARHRACPERSRRAAARSEDPRPYDDAWGWWIEERIARLESGQLWLIRIGIGALVAEVIRILCMALGLGG
jgi:hypothetical protein